MVSAAEAKSKSKSLLYSVRPFLEKYVKLRSPSLSYDALDHGMSDSLVKIVEHHGRVGHVDVYSKVLSQKTKPAESSVFVNFRKS